MVITDLWPRPRSVQVHDGVLRIGITPPARYPRACIVANADLHASAILARRLHASAAPGPEEGCVAICWSVEADAPFAAHLPPDRRFEAYSLEVDGDGIAMVATTEEGLLRAAATLLQLVSDEGDSVSIPHVSIVDWPFFRSRCASDWLLNVEANRWGYDFADGPEAYLERIERKLEMCFQYKINQVWFDGFGWDINRTPQYAGLMRECSRHARSLGIRLTFAGYGGGYGTSYQKSELYRAGYQGEVFINCRPYPDGEEYLCCGLPGYDDARRYGTCPSNEALQEAKLAEMARFVAAVEPGFMYIHDIDAGTLAESHKAWLMRCDECRRRWPSDEMADARGQAGAMAAWFRKVREHLSAVETADGYAPSRDLITIFTSPVYGAAHDAPEVWETEVEYFSTLSRLIGPVGGIQFGFREQFLQPSGEKRIAQLRAALDGVGNGHGIHVISFMGGDNYTSYDLVNTSGAMAHLFEGAASVCLSNGGVFEEPVQLLNAEWLWSGDRAEYIERPGDPDEAERLRRALCYGHHRPAGVFANDGLLRRACHRLWGPEAGEPMYRFYLCGDDGETAPICRVWWAVTREMRRFRGDRVEAEWTWQSVHEKWQRRLQATIKAIGHVSAAADASGDAELSWLVRCLEVGRGFSEALVLATSLKLRDDPTTRAQLAEALDALEAHIEREFTIISADILGGDPGCWLETVELLRDAVLG